MNIGSRKYNSIKVKHTSLHWVTFLLVFFSLFTLWLSIIIWSFQEDFHSKKYWVEIKFHDTLKSHTQLDWLHVNNIIYKSTHTTITNRRKSTVISYQASILYTWKYNVYLIRLIQFNLILFLSPSPVPSKQNTSKSLPEVRTEYSIDNRIERRIEIT